MNSRTTALLTLSLLATMGCAKSAEHIEDELDKKKVSAQMAGEWESPCDKTGLIWEAAGIRSQRLIFNFEEKVAKTTELFSDDSCSDLVGEARYSGTVDVGPKDDNGHNILDMNFLKVEIKVSNQNTVDLLNNPITPGCGIDDWAVNEARDVTSEAGQANCPIANPDQVFDLVETNGEELHFGLVEDGLDKSTSEKR
ncbi:MAG TPA: hypothetical protein VM432_02340, partial [Bdellovibrionales bacterium]|nr:hypothetical protein [Bdellovibrionales bacterium]